MAIHHAQAAKAGRLGFTLEEKDGMVRAFWPKRSTEVWGISTAEAIAQMEAMQFIKDEFETIGSEVNAENPRLVTFINRDNGEVLQGSPMTPHEAAAILRKGEASWHDPTPFTSIPNATEQARIDALQGKEVERLNGVAIDGKIAYSEGTPAGDCPYSSETEDDEEYENFERWNTEWDEAADEADEADEGKGGSVVSERYREIYKERGHPTHCGDWLANTLNELVQNKGGTNLELFEAICELNGVDLSKYNRTTPGWQGRLRMTGRNLLAKRVYLAGGVLRLPETLHGGELRAPGDWMQDQKYKMPKADQAKAIPTPAISPEAE